MEGRPRRSAESVRARAAASPHRLRLGVPALTAVTLKIIDTEGIDAVSMRRVAAEFDTGPASLYAHVRNKDELLRLAYDHAMQEAQVPPDGSWQDVLRAWALEQSRVLQRHNDLAKVGFAHIPSGPRLMEILEVLLRTMDSAGVPKQVAAWALDAVGLYVTADAYEDYLITHSYDDGSGRSSEEAANAAFSNVGDYFRSLDDERFPHVRSHADAMMTGDHRQRFEFGLEMLIAGVERMSERARTD